MLVYLYDSTWDGLLSAIYEAYARREVPERILPVSQHALNWLDHTVEITTDPAKAAKVARSIPLKISNQASQHADRVFRTSDSDKATLIYQYLRLGYQFGRSVDNHLQEDAVRQVHEVSRRVGFEVHRFQGLLRFVKTSWGAYYAQFKPDNHITDLLAPHFAERLADQNWIIHDTRRQVAALYNGQNWILTDALPEALIAQQDSEQHYQAMWRTYFQHIAISERKNLRLQRQFLPARYWQDLTELGLSGSSTSSAPPLNNVGLQPLTAFQAQAKENRPDEPIGDHRNPDPKQTD